MIYTLFLLQVNLVQESHRLVLVVKASPDRIKDSRDDLVAVLQEHSSWYNIQSLLYSVIHISVEKAYF